jgi:hypothetical protein
MTVLVPVAKYGWVAVLLCQFPEQLCLNMLGVDPHDAMALTGDIEGASNE